MKQLFLKPIFSLLFLFSFTACNEKLNAQPNLIASIPEASGVSYCQNSDTLMVANDEGSFYEVTPNGKIINQTKLGDYDLEGVVCEEEQIIFAIEKGSLLRVSRSDFTVKKFKLKGKKAPKLNKKAGIEGIVKIDDEYYLTVQSKDKKEAKFIVVKLGANHAKVKKVIDHSIIDSAGMELHESKLYVVSDKKDKLYIYDLKREKILKKIKLPKFAQEGISFDSKGNVFLANDEGALMKYTKKELGI